MSDDSIDFSFAKERLEETLARIRRESEKQAAERKAGRLKGKLTVSLRRDLRNCNISQLLNVKKLCDRFIQDHRTPPTREECRKHYTLFIVISITVANRRYQREFRRTTSKGRKYVVGPYPYMYWRDGGIIKSKYFKRRDEKSLPRKVRAAFSSVSHEEIELIRNQLKAVVERE